jgi:hypothetical protein
VKLPTKLAATALPGEDAWLIEQLDARDVSGMLRKLRVMVIDRKVYPLHLAISAGFRPGVRTQDRVFRRRIA